MKLQIILFIVASVPMLLELFLIDPHYWNKGKSDKPISTIIRVLMTLAMILIYGAELGLAVLGYYCFFDFAVALKKHRNIFYLGNSKWDNAIKNIPKFLNVFFRIVLASFLWIGYFHIDQGNTVFNPIIDWINNLIFGTL